MICRKGYPVFDKILKNEKFILAIMCLITLISRCLLIFYMDGPFIYADEMGYWSHAANMAGLQWSIDGTAWYSYGYSILLVPLFWITHDMSIIYKMALFLNAVMSVISYLLCYSIARKLAPKLETWLVGVISLIVVMYPSFIAQSYIAWSETALFMFVWFLFWLVIKYEEKHTLWSAVLIGLTAGYLYLVHNRTIGLMVACAMIAVIMVFLKRMRWQDAGAIILMLLAVYLINIPIKEALNVKFTANFMGALKGNGIASGMNRIQKLFSLDGIVGLLYSVSGQLWYLAAATGISILWGIQVCIEDLVKKQEHVLFYGFSLLAFAGMFGISTLTTISAYKTDFSQRVRLDHLFYGRYNECIIGSFLLFGLLWIAQTVIDRKAIVRYGVSGALFVLTAAVFAYEIRNADDFYVQSCNVFGLEYYRWFGEFRVGLCTVAALVLSFILLIGFGQKKKFKYRDVGILLVCGTCIIFFALTGVQGIRSFEMVEQRYTKQYAELFDYIKNLDTDTIYVFGSYKEAADIQNRVVDTEVIRLSDDVTQMDRIQDGDYLVIEESTADIYDIDTYEQCFSYLNYLVLRK